jgi:hypothetical protein
MRYPQFRPEYVELAQRWAVGDCAHGLVCFCDSLEDAQRIAAQMESDLDDDKVSLHQEGPFRGADATTARRF